MEYVECYAGCGDPWFTVALLGAAVVASCLAVSRRAWTLAGALTGLPLAEWYLDGLLLGLLFLAALLVGGLAGRVRTELMLRRIRAISVTALVWACLWLPVGVIAGVYRSFRLQLYDGVPVALPTLEQLSLAILANVAAWMSWGALSGAVFAVLLAFMERRRNVSTLSFPRTAAWGTLGAIALPTVVLAMFLVAEPDFTLLSFAFWPLAISAALGSGCAAYTLLLAKRAPASLPSVNAAGTDSRARSVMTPGAR